LALKVLSRTNSNIWNNHDTKMMYFLHSGNDFFMIYNLYLCQQIQPFKN